MIFIGFLLTINMVYSQEITRDTSYTLPDVQVSATKLEQFSSGQKIQKIDSLSLLLNQNSTSQSPPLVTLSGLGVARAANEM